MLLKTGGCGLLALVLGWFGSGGELQTGRGQAAASTSLIAATGLIQFFGK